MFTNKEIFETVKMLASEHLDIRTITMGISLFDCIRENAKATADCVYSKITKSAKDLVKVADTIANKYGIVIANKRVSVTPISLIGAASGGYVEIAKAMDRAADTLGIDFIGGYTALVQKQMTPFERDFLDTIPQVLSETNKVCSSVNVASTRSGINMDAVKLMSKLIPEAARLTMEKDSIGAAKLVVFANAVEDNPFMAGAFNGIGEGDRIINVGVSGPGVVKCALERVKGDLTEVAECIKQTAFKITRLGQLVAKEAADMLNSSFGIVDLSLAPTATKGDSVADILEEIGLESVGCCGTTAALAMLNDAVKKGGIMASSRVGGLSGAFIPVSEDIGMIKAVESGALSLNKLEAMTAVCSVGIDMVAIPGDTKSEIIGGLIADEMAIGVINNKTTAVRVIPVFNKKAGERVYFGGLLGYAPVMEISPYSPEKFVNRGGLIPAPLHSHKN